MDQEWSKGGGRIDKAIRSHGVAVLVDEAISDNWMSESRLVQWTGKAQTIRAMRVLNTWWGRWMMV